MAFAPPIPDLGPVEQISAPPPAQAEISTPVRIYTDGSILKNPGGAGGWAMVVTHGMSVIELRSGAVEVSTNNRMELRAVIEAMKYFVEQNAAREIEIISDSEYVVKGVNEYMENWRKREWRKVKNLDMWQQIDILWLPHRMKLTWIKGHAGHRFNELADELAGVAARLVRDHA